MHVREAVADQKPPIHISEHDYDLIADLAIQIEQRSPALAATLLDELERADVHDADRLPPDVVALGSEVQFLDEATGAIRRVRLVLPFEADIEAGRLSILTPIGAGLIGVGKGQWIDWLCPDGRAHPLRILEVDQHPEEMHADVAR